MKKNVNLDLVIGWTLIKLVCENHALRKRKHSLDWWKLFVGGFLKCTSVSSEFTFFSSGYFRQVSKQKAAITFWEELEIYCIEYKLEFNCLDWANTYFIAICSVYFLAPSWEEAAICPC